MDPIGKDRLEKAEERINEQLAQKMTFRGSAAAPAAALTSARLVALAGASPARAPRSEEAGSNPAKPHACRAATKPEALWKEKNAKAFAPAASSPFWSKKSAGFLEAKKPSKAAAKKRKKPPTRSSSGPQA